MLQILLGSDQNALREAMLDRLCRNADAGETGQICIVPEPYSHETERRLCEAGGDGICLSAEVLSFTRLSSRVCSSFGGVSRKTLDKGGRLLAMARALETVASRLKLFGGGRRRPEFLLRLLDLIEECKSACIGPPQLRRAAAALEGQLALKLEELALIQDSLETVCAGLGQDANDRLTHLKLLLEQHPYAAGRRIFVFGFTDFTAQQLEVLETMLPDAAQITVGLLGDGVREDGPFTLCAQTARQLRRIAAACGVQEETVLLQAGSQSAAAAFLTSRLFTASAGVWEEPTDQIALHRSTGVYGACMDVAGRIQSLAAQGWRYRDMTICCTEPSLYGPILESVFRRFSIPLYLAGTTPVADDPVAGMALAALEAASGGLEMEDVLRFLKSGLSPLSAGECDRLELYVRTWRIRGRRWEDAWDMHPRGYGFPVDDAVLQELEALNALRRRGVVPLMDLRDALHGAADTGRQAEAFYDFLVRIDLPDRLEALERQCRSEAELQRAQRYAQMYETIVEALEQLHRVLGDTVRTPEEFSRMLGAVLGQSAIGTIPANLDSVTAGAVADLRYRRSRALFLLGAEDGVFPPYQTRAGILSEQERGSLLSVGLSLAPEQQLAMDRELASIYQVLTSASERLYINTASEQPSYLFTRMRSLFPNVAVEEDAALPRILFYDPEALGEAVSGMTPLPLSLESAVSAARTIQERSAHRLGALQPARTELLYGKKLYLSASKIDRYAACRCAYFLHYGLKLLPQKEAAFDAPLYGTFVHAILEETSRQVRQEGGFRVVPPERLEEIARAAIAAYHDDTLSLMLERSERLAYLFRRNSEEVLEVIRELGRELRCSDFEPVGFEVEFSVSGELPPVEIVGGSARAELSGFVDRVDLYTSGGVSYVRVVDYKTGKKAFDYTDILNGMGLQMLIYLFALTDAGENAFGKRLQPAGVLYFPARRTLLPAGAKLTPEAAEAKRRSELTRKGLIVSDDVVLQAMERYERTPLFMPYRVNSRGELTGDLADREELDMLRRHVSRVLAQMADDLAGGAVEPNPIVRGSESSACTCCDYAQVCHRASGELELRPMRKTDRDTFWEILREVERHG